MNCWILSSKSSRAPSCWVMEKRIPAAGLKDKFACGIRGSRLSRLNRERAWRGSVTQATPWPTQKGRKGQKGRMKECSDFGIHGSLLCLWLSALSAGAQDSYEIQVYGAETVARGQTMLELHSNYTFDGNRNVINGVL